MSAIARNCRSLAVIDALPGIVAVAALVGLVCFFTTMADAHQQARGAVVGYGYDLDD